MKRRTLLVAALALGSVVVTEQAWAMQAESAEIPESEAGLRAAALLETIRDGSAEAVRAFFAEHASPGFRDSYPMEMHVRQFERMHGDLGDAVVVGFEQSSPGEGRLILRPSDSKTNIQIRMMLEPDRPQRIAGLMVGTVAGTPPPVEMDAEGRSAAIATVAEVVEREYVAADTGLVIANNIRERERSGAYDGLTEWSQLARALTEDLRAINGDRHLGVRFGDGPGGPAGQPRERRQAGGPGDRGEGPVVARRPPESDPGRDGSGSVAPGLQRVDRLPGNVGYIQLDLIVPPPAIQSALVEALAELGDTDAMILDLRGVPGGSAETANLLISHFTEPNVPSLAIYSRERDATTYRHTLSEVPGPRRTDVPVYVLVDSGSASAAEDIPFVLQNLGRATIVGERTAGAGRNNRIVFIGNGLAVSVSVTRIHDPASGREWERIGIQPDIETRSGEALIVAHEHALRTLHGAADSAARRRQLERELRDVERRRNGAGASLPG